MLHHTFIHLPGISERRERALWRQGIWTWKQLEAVLPQLRAVVQRDLFGDLSDPLRKPREQIDDVWQRSFEALKTGDSAFFAKRLQSKEHYRIALSFPKSTAFLDIETTGLSHYYDHTTIIGVSIGDEYRCFVRGGETSEVINFMRRAKCIVTFNGTSFDLKFLRKEFPEIPLPEAHVDLRYLARRVGLIGGQKAIEVKLDLARSEEVAAVIGEKAPMLWHDYRMGDLQALKTLIQYNHADVEGMKTIFDQATERLWASDPEIINFKHHRFSNHPSRIVWARKPATARRNSIYLVPFRGRTGPRITFNDLTMHNSQALKVVGIDLTGSETRPSGWCSLDGNLAETQMLGSDDNLIQATLGAAPHLVSIDSPLSLPFGRTKVTDDDPMRLEIGIMRWCERELKRRGVNVYPCLIPSMQRLTERGMRLASKLRELGLPVIESYPGAAQDIMNIPRKRAGLEYLTKGLVDFGLDGKFRHNATKHDELDAITSAVVGLFFWSGRFEALGNSDEDYLIIPSLSETGENWRTRNVAGFSGPISSGKTTAARHLEKNRMTYGRFSLLLEEELRRQGREVNRDNLQQIGEQIHKHPGQRWLATKLADRFGTARNIVIDGIRFPEDHAYFVERFGPAFLHIFVSASEEIRKERYIKSEHSESDFKKANRHPVEQAVVTLSERAHILIENNGSLSGFLSRVSKAINIRHLSKAEREAACQ